MNKVITIIGPTTAGKTSLCLALAEYVPIEVISADSRQIYRGMDIGTAKVTPAERQRVPHHLIDIKNPDEVYSAYEFLLDCRKKIEEIRKRERIPVICGGTIFYIKALLEGMFLEPEIPDEIRYEVREEIERKGSAEMHGKLEKIDPDSAKRIHPNDKQRISRAIEVYRASGTTLTEFWEKGNQNKIPLDLFSLLLSKKKLRERIEKRVIKMFEDGFVDEVRNLLKKGYKPSLYSFTSIGYEQISKYILNGNGVNMEETRDEIIKETKKYADRQITFIKGLPKVKIYKNEEKLKAELIEKIQEKKN
jgi:tRNA dimethylallyltransferase